MNPLRRVSVVAGCALATIVVLEVLQWLRPAALLVARETAPYVRMDDDGAVTLEKLDRIEYDDSRGWEWIRNVYDESGRLLSSTPTDFQSDAKLGLIARDNASRASNPWVRAEQVDTRCVEQDGASVVLRTLRMASGMNYHSPPVVGRSHNDGTIRMTAFAWNYEDGRFVCRNPQTGAVVAGFGPDGYATGPSAAGGEKFAVGLTSPIGRFGWYSPDGGRLGVLLDSEGRRVHFLRVADKPKPPPGEKAAILTPEPLRVEVVTVPVAGPSGEAPAAAGDDRFAWLWQFGASPKETLVVPLRAGRDLVLVSAAGIVYRVPLAEEERDVIAFGDARCVTTVLPPVGGPVARLRVRRILDGGRVLTDDVETIPVTTGGRVAAASVGVLSLLRPPVLNVASFAGPRVANYADCFGRWFTDGVIAGGDGASWLGGSLAIGAVCGWLVRRRALLRAPDRATRWTVLGAALGPLAFVFTAIALPRSNVVSCACGRRRAVHVENCPSCSLRWPGPAPTGIEVFA